MHPTSTRPARRPAQARTGYRRHRGILALLAALACLAGFAMVELKTSPSGPARLATATRWCPSPPGRRSPSARHWRSRSVPPVRWCVSRWRGRVQDCRGALGLQVIDGYRTAAAQRAIIRVVRRRAPRISPGSRRSRTRNGSPAVSSRRWRWRRMWPALRPDAVEIETFSAMRHRGHGGNRIHVDVCVPHRAARSAAGHTEASSGRLSQFHQASRPGSTASEDESSWSCARYQAAVRRRPSRTGTCGR
jgi:hypothetical protein